MRSRSGEEIKGNLKIAVFMSILPKDYKEEILKMGSEDKKLEYEGIRNYVLSLAQQRASSKNPRPSDVLGVEGQEEGMPVEE
eukprot:11941161-Karenia_brevis.AAC.1